MAAAGGYWYVRNLIAVGNPIPYIGSVGPISLPAPVRDFQPAARLRRGALLARHRRVAALVRAGPARVVRDAVAADPGGDAGGGRVRDLARARADPAGPRRRRDRHRDRLRVHAADRRRRAGAADLLRVERPLPGARRGAGPGDPALPARAAGNAPAPGGGPGRAHRAAGVHGRLACAVEAGPRQGRGGRRRCWWSPSPSSWPSCAHAACWARPAAGAFGWRWRGSPWPRRSRPVTASRTTTSPTATRTPARPRTSPTRCAGRGTCATRGSPSPGSARVFTQYPFYGTDLSNRVQWLGVRGPHDSYQRIPNCRQWRRAINAGGFTHVVTTFDPYLPDDLHNSPEGRWTQSDPNAHVVLRDGPGEGVRAPRAARSRRLRGPEAAHPGPASQRSQPQRDPVEGRLRRGPRGARRPRRPHGSRAAPPNAPAPAAPAGPAPPRPPARPTDSPSVRIGHAPRTRWAIQGSHSGPPGRRL